VVTTLHGYALQMHLYLCTIVVYNTAQNSSDNLPGYPPDNHHSSDNSLLEERGVTECEVVPVFVAIFSCAMSTFSEPLMTKYPPGSSGHSFSSVRSRSVRPFNRQYVDRSIIGILPMNVFWCWVSIGVSPSRITVLEISTYNGAEYLQSNMTMLLLYTVSRKKMCHFIFDYNFGFSWSIFYTFCRLSTETRMNVSRHVATPIKENYYINRIHIWYFLESDRLHDEARYRLPDSYVTLKPITDDNNRCISWHPTPQRTECSRYVVL